MVKKHKIAHSKESKHAVWHSSQSRYGMGDYYGQAKRQKMGKARDLYTPGVNPVSGKKLKKPPKTLA